MKRFWCAATAAVLVAAALASPQDTGAAPSGLPFTLKGASYHLEPWDYGALFGCRPGAHVGVLLMGRRGRVWSFAPYGDLARLQAHGCGAVAVVSQLVGVGVEQTAHFAVAVHSCAATCTGYDFWAFWFDGTRAYEELGQTLGEGGWKFKFPSLVLYVNTRYRDCPSHWTRLSYRWTDGYLSRYVLQKSISYTSRQCFLSKPKKWPPDPGT
jgi:hypothetical protein